jgi:hypothetical protein
MVDMEKYYPEIDNKNEESAMPEVSQLTPEKS